MNKKYVKDSTFLQEYVKQMTQSVMDLYPKLPKDKVKEIIIKRVEKDLMNPNVKAENTYTRERIQATLLGAIDYVLDTKPIIAANATFFRHHDESLNANSEMLKEFGSSRKVNKDKMFEAEQNGDIRRHKMFDIDQNNDKKLGNSWYGVSLLPSSPFFNRECGAATTKTARSVISTAMTTFEATLGNTFTFVDIHEFFDWIKRVDAEGDDILDDWVERKTAEDCYERFSERILKREPRDMDIMWKKLHSLGKKLLTRLYWKYNLFEFTRTHSFIHDLFRKIYSDIGVYHMMTSDDDFSVVPEQYLNQIKASDKPMRTWNKMAQGFLFYNPNNAPASIKDTLITLNSYMIKYIFVEHMFLDRMYKLKNFRRNVVTTIDTDSNILALDPWIDYCFDELMEGDYGRTKRDNVFININVTTYIISDIIARTLAYYGKMSNVAEEHRWRLSMKNEFFFDKLILAPVKKRYLNRMILREGNLLLKPKYDIKGFDFKKASTSDESSAFYMDLVRDEILDKDEIDVAMILRKLREFRKEVYRSLQAGESKYLPRESPKELAAYLDYRGEQSIRATFAWNIMYPHEAISLPGKISVLKTKIYKLDMIQELEERDPRMYEDIRDQIFGDVTGLFNKHTTAGSRSEGLSVIGLPLDHEIPDWIIPHIDYKTVVNNVLSPFKSITETFGIPSLMEGHAPRKSVGFSNILKL